MVDVPREAALDQALHRRLEQPRPHRAGALLLRHADRPRLAAHRASMARVINKQSSLTFCDSERSAQPSRATSGSRERAASADDQRR